MTFRETSGYLKGLKFIVCKRCGKQGVKWTFVKDEKFKRCRYCNAESKREKIK